MRINNHIGSKYGPIRLSDKEIEILDFPTCLKIIRCFGASITKLAINSKIVSDRQYDELDHYLDEYCTESMVELEYVKTVRFSDFEFRSKRGEINERFPNLRALFLKTLNPTECFMTPFPHRALQI